MNSPSDADPPFPIADYGAPTDRERLAFTAGARWWEWEKEGATMWPSDRERAYEAAGDEIPRFLQRVHRDTGRDLRPAHADLALEDLQAAIERVAQYMQGCDEVSVRFAWGDLPENERQQWREQAQTLMFARKVLP